MEEEEDALVDLSLFPLFLTPLRYPFSWTISSLYFTLSSSFFYSAQSIIVLLKEDVNVYKFSLVTVVLYPVVDALVAVSSIDEAVLLLKLLALLRDIHLFDVNN